MLQTTRDVFVSKQNITETVHSVRETKVLFKVFTALSKQCGCPQEASNKYFNLMCHRINSEGAGFLKVLAAQQVLGLRVVGNDIPKPADYGLKVRKRTGFPILFAWFYSRLAQLSEAEPTKKNALEIQRILTVMSIGKMLTLGSTARINKERKSYAERVSRSIDCSKVED
jgi:predicted solute-binding protein